MNIEKKDNANAINIILEMIKWWSDAISWHILEIDKELKVLNERLRWLHEYTTEEEEV